MCACNCNAGLWSGKVMPYCIGTTVSFTYSFVPYMYDRMIRFAKRRRTILMCSHAVNTKTRILEVLKNKNI